jgi:hypothetical protein
MKSIVLNKKRKPKLNNNQINELNEQIAIIDSRIAKLQENLELFDLNIDACAHRQEHIGHFMLSFLTVGVLISITLVLVFSLTVASSEFDYYFLLFDIDSLITI